MVAKNSTGNLVMKPILILSAASDGSANAVAMASPPSNARPSLIGNLPLLDSPHGTVRSSSAAGRRDKFVRGSRPDDHRDQLLLIGLGGHEFADLPSLPQHHGAAGEFGDVLH